MLKRIAAGESIPTVATSMIAELPMTQVALERRLRRRLEKADGILDERRIVSVENEQYILGVIKAFASANRPLHLDELRRLACLLSQYDDFDARQWALAFLERHKKFIVLRNNKTIASSRMAPKIIDDVEHYIAGYELLRNDHPTGPRGIMSLDEFLLSFTGSILGGRVIEWTRRRQKAVHVPRLSRVGSICFVTSATGCVVAKFVILRSGRLSENTEEAEFVLPVTRRLRRHETTNMWYTTAPNGVMDNEIFAMIVDKLIELKETGLDHLGVGLDRHLRFDGLDQHCQPDLLIKLIEAGIYPVILPPGTSAFTAVEDDDFFGCMRRHLNENMSVFVGEAVTKSSQVAVIWRALELAEAEAEQPRVVKASYRNVGAYPWDPTIIRRRARRVTGLDLPHSSTEPPAVHEAALAAQMILNRRVSDAAVPSESGVAPIKKRTRAFETAEEVIERKRRRVEEKASKAAAKEAKQLAVRAKKEHAALVKVEKARVKTEKQLAKHAAAAGGSTKSKRARNTTSTGDGGARLATSQCVVCEEMWDEEKMQVWIGCSYCRSFYVCARHKFARAVVNEHERSVHV